MQTKLCDDNLKTKILYDANLTNLEEINQFWGCISRLAEGDFRNTKKLEDFSYYGRPVFRAWANYTDRVTYTFAPTLCILATTPHKYEQLKRRFAAKKSPNNELPDLEILELPENPSPIMEKISETRELQFTAAVPYKEEMLEWDDVQREAHSSQEDSIIFRGCPGAGKTLVVYHSFLRYLSNLAEPNPEKPQDEILFIAPKGLIKNLIEEYEKSGLKHKVRFISWDDYLASFYPIGTKPVTEEYFKTWLASLKDESWLKSEDSGEIHYELSLIAALGSDEYIKLGKRQSYFAHNKDIQAKLISILAKWQQHLKDLKTYDPMVSVPTVKPVFLKKFYDETQNLPPTALAYLVGLPGDCIASLDGDQCLDSSPFIDNFLKGLFNLRYGKKGYQEFLLEDSYRNPPEVFAVGASILKFKHKRDTIGYRQGNKNAESKLPKDSGLVSLIDKKHQVELKPTCTSATTVVVVIANAVSDLLRQKIKEELGCNNIITAKDVIGLEFENVILYDPISQSSIKGCAGSGVGISLRQLKDLCAVYVAVTRSKKNVYILDNEALDRWPKLIEELFGKFLPLNKLAQGEIKSSNEDFEALALKYYKEGQIGNAKEILRFYLKYDEDQIQKFIANARATASPVLSIPQEQKNETVSAKSDSIPQIPKIEKDPTHKTTLLKKVNEYFERKQPAKAVQIMREELKFSEAMIQTILKSKETSQSSPAPKIPIAKSGNQKKEVSKSNKISMTPAQTQRAQKLFKNFTKKNVQSELAEPDCAIVLFEPPFEIFSQCLKDSRKWKILRNAIEEITPKVAENLLSVILTKTMPAANLLGWKPTKEMSMIRYFILKEKSMKKTIIHNLFEKLSPSQKVAFLTDSIAYAKVNSDEDNACFSSDLRTVPLMPDIAAIKSDSKALISLLCKPVKYFNCSTYASALAGLELGANLMINLIDEVELFEFIAENLYTSDSFASIRIASIFEGLCSHNSGLYLLNMLYERDPKLKSKIKVEYLMPSRDGISPILYNLYQNSMAHPILNDITTKELAAKYPLGLPNSCVNLLLLSSTEEGIKVIQKMMDAQPSLVNLMTGTVLSFPGYNKRFIFHSLCAYEAGVSILHQLLDVHHENLVKNIACVIHNPIDTQGSHQTAYQLLKKSEEGKRFLKRLKGFGWNPPSAQNPFNFFANEPDSKSIELLMHYIATENTEKVQKMVRANPRILLERGNVKKDGILYESLRPIEYCQMHGDCIRMKAMVDCLNDSEEGQYVKNILFSSQNSFKFA